MKKLGPLFKKPYGAPYSIHPILRRYATSIYPLNRPTGRAEDALGQNHIPFSAAAAMPNWNGRAAQPALCFDGGDDASGAIVSTVNAFPLWIGVGFTCDNFGALQAPFSIGTSDAANPMRIEFRQNTNSTINFLCRILFGGVGANFTGATVSIGSVNHCVAITRGQTDHTTFINGQKTTSATDVGTSWSTAVNIAIGANKANVIQSQITGGVLWAAFGQSDPGNQFLQDLSINPWRYLYAPQRRVNYGQAAVAATTRPVKMAGEWGGFAGLSGGFAG